MPAVKDSDLFKQLKTGVPSGGYYLYGPETAFSLAALRRLEAEHAGIVKSGRTHASTRQNSIWQNSPRHATRCR